MKVRITTQYGEFTAELDKDMKAVNLFSELAGETVGFTVMPEDGNPIRVTMLKRLIRIVEEDL